MDKYYIYRPLLDMIGYTEGTKEKDGYNETLAYGKFTGGNVDLVKMDLNQIDALQTKMLAHEENDWNSSALGMYQIVRTTLRSIKKTLKLNNNDLFDAEMQDRMACFLLGSRGIDTYLEGKLSEDDLILNLAKEWASLPTPNGRGYYSGQHARIQTEYVRDVLAEVKARYELRGKETPTTPTAPVEEEEKPSKAPLWIVIPLIVGTGILITMGYIIG